MSGLQNPRTNWSARGHGSRWLAPAALVAVLATFAGVYFATQVRYAYAMTVRTPWREALTINLTFYYLWAAAVPLVAWLARRFPLHSATWRRSIAVHLLGGIILTLVQLLLGDVLVRLLGLHLSVPFPASVAKSIRLNFHSSLPTYWLILFGYSAWDYYRRYRDRELRASQLEAELSAAKLEALRAQLNPHFLFNTMNSISSLMYSDVEAADRMMTLLSDLLRLTLEKSSQELALREEMEILQRYLDIEKIRFEERLQVSIDVDERVLGALVPAFSLQPIVENALRHAIGPRPEGGRMDIRAYRDDGLLRVSIEDDGPGLSDDVPRRGVGLSNVSARLAQLYPGRESLVLTRSARGGLAVELSIPYQEAEPVEIPRVDRG